MYSGMKKLQLDRTKGRNNRIRFLAYFIIVSLLASGIVGSLLYMHTSKALEKEEIESNRSILMQLNKSTDMLLSQIDRYLSQLTVNPDIPSLMDYYRANDVLQIKRINNNLSNILNLSDYVYSTMLYYTDENKVFVVNNGVIDIEDFTGMEIIERTRKSLPFVKIIPSVEITDILMNKTVNVISVVKTIPQGSINPSVFAIVNIEERYLRSIINSLTDNNREEIYITDKEGFIISKNRVDRKYERLINKDFLDNINGSNHGYRIERLGDEKILVSYVTSDAYNWKYISFIPYDRVVENVRFVRDYSVIVTLLAVLVGIIVSLFFSNRISKPLNAIAGLFKNYSSPYNEKNIFTYIKKNVEDLVEKNEAIENTLETHMPVLKNNYLCSVLMGAVTDDREIEERFFYYGIDMGVNDNYLVYLISLDSYRSMSSRYSERQINLLMVYLIKVLNELVNKNNKGVVVNTNTSEIAIILSLSDNEAANGYKEIISRLGEDIRNTILDKIKYTTANAIGNVYKGMGQVHRSYEEASEALQYRVLLGNESIIFYDEIKSLKEDIYDYPYKVENDILDALKQGDADSAVQLNNEIFRAFINSINSNNETLYYYMMLLNSTIKCC